ECGVYRGGFAKWIARFMPDRKLYLFDTFEGFDNRDIDEKEEFYTGAFRRIYKFDDTSVDIVLKNIGEYRDTVVRKGYFPDTASGLENERFAFVSLDTDLYKPILAGLEFFYPRLNPGGYIFVDDYGQIEGVRQAVLEYSQANGCGYMRLSDNTRTAVVVKPLGR
ncbi:MAG: class I SAM-dependent methyltransferase, partial [Selenomonadaceae bacterium]|nr:class I SAM-dependent methyltransferase [Selenomonadaceae bacterium]